MAEWLQTLYDRGVLGVPGVLVQKTGTCGAGSSVPPGVPGVAEHLEGTPGTPGKTPAEATNSLSYNQEHRKHREHLQSGDGLRDWSRGLASVDPLAPRSGWPADRWVRLYDAGLWWFESFGQQAARDGWATGDVFGVFPAREGWGGLLDRVGDNRTLLLSSDRASWRSYGVAQSYNRTAGTGLRPFWEIDL